MSHNVNVYSFNINDVESFEKARQIRDKVFVLEQEVNRSDEFDEFEGICTHYLLEIDGKTAGTARWREKDEKVKLERFAVYREFRNKGYGDVLLKKVIEDALKTGMDLYMHAQLKAIPFYERRGFQKVGAQFSECDIEHYRMELKNHKSITTY